MYRYVIGVHQSWLNLFLVDILVRDPLINLLTDYMIVLSPFLAVIKMPLSLASFHKQLEFLARRMLSFDLLSK